MSRKPPTPVNTVIITHHSKVLDRHLGLPLVGLWIGLFGLSSVFAALFLAFTLVFNQFQDAFVSAARAQSGVLVAINGGLLLAAGLAVARAIMAERTARPARIPGYLGVALLALVGFLGARFFGYYQAYQAGLISLIDLGDRPFSFSGPSPHDALLFFDFYFAVSALHTLLVLLGGLLLAAILLGSMRRKKSSRIDVWLTASGVYAAFLILTWLGSFFAFYLSGRFYG